MTWVAWALFTLEEVSVGPTCWPARCRPWPWWRPWCAKIPGVLGNEASVVEESFSAELGGAAEYPHYTRPREYLGEEVPDILLSGNHGAIAAWRREQACPSAWLEWAQPRALEWGRCRGGGRRHDPGRLRTGRGGGGWRRSIAGCRCRTATG